MKGALLVFLGACSYGILSTIVKLAYSAGFNVGEVTGSQAFLGVVGLWAMVAFKAIGQANAYKIIPAKKALRILLAGIPSGATSIFYYQCVQYLPASMAILLLFQFTWIGTLIDVLFFKKKPGKVQILSLLMLVGGTIMASGVLSGNTEALDPKGILYGMGAALSFALFMLVNGRVGNDVPSSQKSALMLTGATILIFSVFPPYFLINGSLSSGLLEYGIPLALFGTVIPPLFFAMGVPKVGLSSAAVLGAAELPVAVLCGALILHESVGPLQWLGVAIILTGIALPALMKKRNNLSAA